MSKNWYPIIDYDKCIGCMVCNDMCRHGVYKPDEEIRKPKVVYGNGCVHGCHGCERKCPAGAIRYCGDDGTIDIDYDYDTYKPEIICNGKPRVTFICVHNSCRSQMAEALGKLYASDVFESFSAGTELKDRINLDAVRLMKKLYGIDMEETQYNKLIDDIPQPDVVIFMGCNVSCPDVPSQYAENWGLEDPTGRSDEEFEVIIRKIEKNIHRLKKRLL
ncbi:MAG: 4Fe-4S binding protein [Ruminococcus sp.]|nr:4Fe-4S binding protein [Ruminococcus sp.]